MLVFVHMVGNALHITDKYLGAVRGTAYALDTLFDRMRDRIDGIRD